MDARQMAAMAEATRLTRQGRLIEATVLIQQTLAGPPVTRRAPDAPCAGQAGGGSGRSADAPPLPAARGTTPPRRIAPGWTRRRAVPDRGAAHRGLAARPAAPSARPAAPSARPAAPFRPGVPAPRRRAGRFEAFSYTNAAGSRAYRLYAPAGHTGGPLPLIVMLHGGTQDAAAFAAATAMNDLAERETFLVAYPEQARSANAGRYWNWFAPAHQRRDAGEPSLIAGITRQVMDRYEVDAARVYVGGFSAGGAMAAVMGAVYPDLYAAVGVHSGLAYAAADDVPSALAAMRQGPPHRGRPPARPRPLIVFHGDQDAIVAPVNATGLIGHVLAAGVTPITVISGGQVPGGHAYTRRCYQDPAGAVLAECWTIHQSGHGWSGGVPHGSYTDPRGPDASAEFIRFFAAHPGSPAAR